MINLKMNFFLLFFNILICLNINGQQYDSVIIEEENIDSNNQVYKLGNFYTFDYKVIIDGKSFKLKENARNESELIIDSSSFENVDKIHLLIVSPDIEFGRLNENQTDIMYYQAPIFSGGEVTSVVDNKDNVWLHPTRSGFFKSLETCPFPYILKPYKVGAEWTDAMLIGSHWSNEKWGMWKGNLLLKYNYKIAAKEKLDTKFGKIDCYVVESSASSLLGTSFLKSYFSEKYGFVRFEYKMVTGLIVNLWLIDFKENQKFNDGYAIMTTGEIIKN